MLFELLASVSLLIWIYLVCARGAFWLASRNLARPAAPAVARKVIAIIPARNEAVTIGSTIASLAKQELFGTVQVVLIDDGSTDGTELAAQAAAARLGFERNLIILRGEPLPAGWTGKLWAMSQGVALAGAHGADYYLFTDADIDHAPDSIATLISTAENGGFDLVTQMVRLRTTSFAERLLIPAFVYFFFLLYPPDWVASPRKRIAAAAGGCMLIRPKILARAGGLDAIRSQLIDDCVLAAAVKKAGGRISLTLSRKTCSLRRYDSFAELGSMISRSAFSQLNHSYIALAATTAGLLLTYVLPIASLLTGERLSMCFGATALVLMSITYLPMVRFYRLAPAWCLCLPMIAAIYMGATIHSAIQHALGRGGRWKGRIQDLR